MLATTELIIFQWLLLSSRFLKPLRSKSPSGALFPTFPGLSPCLHLGEGFASESEDEKQPVVLKACYAYPCQTTNSAGGKGAAQKAKCSEAESRNWRSWWLNQVGVARHKIMSHCHFKMRGRNRDWIVD